MASITDGNYLVSNQGKNPLVNFNFMLRVELLYDLPCKSVRSFSKELEYDIIQEGGLNDYVHMRRKPISKPFTLEVERYVGVDYIDPLPLGAELVLPVMLFVSRTPNQFIPFVVARTYVFTGCSVIKKTYGDLVADSSGLLVETTTLAYREMLCVDIPWSEVGDNIFAEKPTPATSAITANKSAEDLKSQGNEYYARAKEAADKVKSDYSEEKTNTIIKYVSDAVTALTGAVTTGGSLAAAFASAEASLRDASGETLKELANKARVELTDADRALRNATRDLNDKTKLLNVANDKVARTEEKIKDCTERNKALTEQLTALDTLASTLETSLPEDCNTRDAAEEALDKAEKSYDEAQRALRTPQAEYDNLSEQLKVLEEEKNSSGDDENSPAAIKYKEAQEELAKKKEALDTALKALTDATTARDNAAKVLDDVRKLEETNKSIEMTNAKISDLGAEISAENERLASAKAEQSTATANLTSAKTAVTNAEEALKAAQTKSDAANAKSSLADKTLASARAALNNAKKLLSALRNNLTNLERRKEKSKDSSVITSESEAECKTENDALQEISDSDVPALRTACDKVYKLMRETLFNMQQTLEINQYLDYAESMLREANDIMPDAVTYYGEVTDTEEPTE